MLNNKYIFMIECLIFLRKVENLYKIVFYSSASPIYAPAKVEKINA